MSKQRDILSDVLGIVLRHCPECAVFLSGSVAFGNERPDSDIDLGAIMPDVSAAHYPGGQVRDENEGFKLVDASFDNVSLEIIYLTPGHFQELLVHKPWRGYKFLFVEILHDPMGLIQSWKDRIAPWFEDHSDVVELWEQWLVEHADRQMSRGRKLGPIIRRFPDMMSDLWPHLDARFSIGHTAKSGS